MNSLDDPVEFFRFLKQNASLFTCCALFATFFYYVVSLLKDPNSRLEAINTTELNTNFTHLSPEIQVIANQVVSLQIAAVISFSIFAIILISIIFIAWRYGIFARLFSFLLFFLIYFAFIYLYAAFKESIYGFLAIGIPVIIAYLYIETIEYLQKRYQKHPSFDFGFFWFIIFDILLLIIFGTIPLINFLKAIGPSIELWYFLLFLLMVMMTSMIIVFLHIMTLLFIVYKRSKITTLFSFRD